jgi:signal peptidase
MAMTIGWVVRSAALVHLTWFLSLLMWVWLPVGLGDARVAVITSGSMTPNIQPGDVVVYDRVEPQEVTVGQILLVDDPASPGNLLTHRVIGHTAAGEFVTKGDANANADSSPVPLANVLGRGRLLVPVVGRVALWNQSGTLVWLGAVVLSVLLVTHDAMIMLASARARQVAADAHGRHRWRPRHVAFAGRLTPAGRA